MVFSLGNIITLVIVILILAIYRQVDRNNRSLEKIRRYSDKITGELDRFVDDKTVELKNLAVELDVHQKTGREILKRINGVEESLGERTEGIQRIADRIDEYDTAIGSLMGLTSKVDENMKRLQEESSFVDSTGKRLKDVQGRLEGLEKRVPVLTDEFAALNARELDALRREVLEDTERRTGELSEEIQGAARDVEDFSRRMDDIDGRWERMDEETLAKVEAGHREILDRSTREGEALRTSFEEGMKETVKKLHAYQEKLRREGESLDAAFDEKLTVLQERTRSLEDSFTASLESAAQRGRDLEDEVFGELKTYITGQARGLEKDMQALFLEEREKIALSARELESTLAALEEKTDRWQEQISVRLSQDADVFNTLITEKNEVLSERLTKQSEDITTLITEKTEALSSRFIKETDDIDALMTEKTVALNSRFARETENIDALITEKTEALGCRFALDTEDIAARMSRESASVKARFEDLAQGIEMRMGEVDGSVEAEQNRRRDELSQFVATVKEELSSMQTSSGAALKNMEEQAGRGLQELERQIGSYEEEINYRISRIEKVGDEITVLDENLRQSIDRMVLGVREEFSEARQELLNHIDGENVEVRQRVEAVKQHMGALEKDLEELKARAYDNVTEKLQVFEDDFFKDLRDREESQRRQFADWQEGLSRELEQMGEDHNGQRDQLAKELGDELRDRLTQLQSKTFQQYEKYEDQVSNYQERINERISLSERSLEGLEEILKRQIQDIRQNSQVEFEKEFTEHKTGVEGALKRWEREWEIGVKEQEEKMAAGFRDLTAGMDAANSDVTVWQTQAQQRLKEISADVEERYNQLQADAHTTVETINKDFVEQRDAFDSFYLDLQKRSKDLEIAIEQKLRDFRSASTEIREKVEAVQQRLFGKVEEHHKTLMVNLQEIDKQQKSFIAQTKIFDRADSLKMALQEHIEDLKVEIARITAQSKEVKEAERKFLTIKKMNDEVTSKLSRFLTEKRRIEEMEGDFKKLINLSQSIDIKLDQVTTSHDTLQEVQLRIRALEELEAEVFQKYDRLEKKGGILESTTEDVDRNFQRLQDLEAGLKGIEGSVAALVPQVTEVGAQIKIISKERGKTAEAIEMINGLDRMLNEIEDRTERMQKAREWLAGTETRLEEVNREAQEQVKLLGSLVKEGGISKQGKGSSLGARDVVAKLARQGWTVEEIARTTKLSRGEVELILELRK